MVEAAREVATPFNSEALFTSVKVISPRNVLLDVARLMLPPLPSKVTLPPPTPCVMVPVCEIPVPVKLKVP